MRTELEKKGIIYLRKLEVKDILIKICLTISFVSILLSFVGMGFVFCGNEEIGVILILPMIILFTIFCFYIVVKYIYEIWTNDKNKNSRRNSK